MIVDAHAHFGSILDFHIPEELLIRSMERFGIDAAVVSCVEGAEHDHDGRPLPAEILRDQTAVGRNTMAFARRYPGKIFPLIWAMPHTGGATEAFETFLAENRSGLYGIKIHPYLNQAAFDSSLIEPYIRLAARYSLPVVSHTASTDESSPARVAKMAEKYPQVRFLLVHMGLYTDHRESIDLILKHPNLYGDTSWVEPESAAVLIRAGGIDKILFGTDSPVAGEDGYAAPICRTYLQDWKTILCPTDYKKLMCDNAVRFFDLPADAGGPKTGFAIDGSMKGRGEQP